MTDTAPCHILVHTALTGDGHLFACSLGTCTGDQTCAGGVCDGSGSSDWPANNPNVASWSSWFGSWSCFPVTSHLCKFYNNPTFDSLIECCSACTGILALVEKQFWSLPSVFKLKTIMFGVLDRLPRLCRFFVFYCLKKVLPEGRCWIWPRPGLRRVRASSLHVACICNDHACTSL